MAEHQHRIAAATNATTLGELERLLTDLQSAQTPLAARSRRVPRGSAKYWALVAVAATAVVALIVAVLVFDDGDTDAPPPDADAKTTTAAPAPAPTTTIADPEPSVLALPRELHTVEGMTGLLDQMRKRFGDTTGIELAITPDEAMLFRPDPTDDQSKLFYRFNGGWGDPTRRPRDETDDSVDLGAFDVNAVAAVLRDAPTTLGIPAADVTEVFVDVDHIAEPPGPGALELLVKVESTRGDGYIYLDSAGNTKRVEQPS